MDHLGMELPNLPYLFDESVRLTETLAIMKYIAKKWKPELLGRTAAEVGRVNMLEWHVMELKKDSTYPCYDPNGDAEQIVSNIRQIGRAHV